MRKPNTPSDADTGDLTINEKLDIILRRLSTLEDDSRRETRPKLDLIISEITELREQNKEILKRIGWIEGHLFTKP